MKWFLRIGAAVVLSTMCMGSGGQFSGHGGCSAEADPPPNMPYTQPDEPATEPLDARFQGVWTVLELREDRCSAILGNQHGHRMHLAANVSLKVLFVGDKITLTAGGDDVSDVRLVTQNSPGGLLETLPITVNMAPTAASTAAPLAEMPEQIEPRK